MTMLRVVAVAAAAAMTTVLGVAPAEAVPGWHATLLPLPEGHPNATGYLTGTDGKGGYAGAFAIGDTMQVVTWKDGKPTIRGLPAGFTSANVFDQNNSGVVLLNAWDVRTGESRIFTLDDRGFHQVPLPMGYSAGSSQAINDRGDILGFVWSETSTRSETVVWPVLGVGPMIVPLAEGESAKDLDDDGAVLVNAGGSSYLWRNGEVRKLEVPSGHARVYGQAVRKGAVAGFATPRGLEERKGFVWAAPGTPQELPEAAVGEWINASGLIGGRLPLPQTSDGPPAAWQGTKFLGKLPLPDGFARAKVNAVGDDGAIVGVVTNGWPDDGGSPVVWRQVGIG